MTFTTLTFIIFLIVVFTVYWSLRQRSRQNLFLVIASYFFYGWWDYRFCLLLFASSLVDYYLGRLMDRSEKPLVRRSLLLISLVHNLGVLGFFKYWNFFTGSLGHALDAVGWHLDIVTLNVILPAGISFYTFQTLSYTIDIYRRDLRPAKNLIDYLCYLSFFPQLVAGPIERATHLLPQVMRDRTFSFSLASEGCRQILWGFFKKMVIADNLAPIVDMAFGDPKALSGPQLVVAALAFTFQIYCDFSAYSDIAIGTARLFDFSLMRNFAYPYFSQSMAEFWRRWHISLSTWLKDYVYIPLGGSRVPPLRRSMNIMITFLISGLWHGAAWNYVAWGGLLGVIILVERLWVRQDALKVDQIPGGNTLIPSPRVLLNMAITFSLTTVAWIFFRAKGVKDALVIIRKIITESLNPASYATFGDVFDPAFLSGGVLVLLVIGFVLVEWLRRPYAHPLMIEKWPSPLRWATYTALIWITLFFGTWNTGQFVYFQF